MGALVGPLVATFVLQSVMPALAGEVDYQNPVIGSNSPDPGVMCSSGASPGSLQCFAATTSGNDPTRFPIWTSRTMANWTAVSSLFTADTQPSWAVSDFWAPEIHPAATGGGFVAVFTARNTSGYLSIGVARSQSPTGPWKDVGRPLVLDDLGAIDGTLFQDPQSQRPFLAWKRDGNSAGRPTPIFVAPLAADYTALASSPSQLLTNDQEWEGPLVEAPWLVFRSPYYYLFYSGNINAAYAIGVARSTSLRGPFAKRGPPILSSGQHCVDAGVGSAWVGPGHCSVFESPTGDGRWAVVYHAWVNDPPISFAKPRFAMLDALAFGDDGWPTAGQNGCPSQAARPLPLLHGGGVG